MYVVSYFFSGRLPLGTSEGGRGSVRREGAMGVGVVEGGPGRWLSERVKACSQTVGEGALLRRSFIQVLIICSV